MKLKFEDGCVEALFDVRVTTLLEEYCGALFLIDDTGQVESCERDGTPVPVMSRPVSDFSWTCANEVRLGVRIRGTYYPDSIAFELPSYRGEVTVEFCGRQLPIRYMRDRVYTDTNMPATYVQLTLREMLSAVDAEEAVRLLTENHALIPHAPDGLLEMLPAELNSAHSAL